MIYLLIPFGFLLLCLGSFIASVCLIVFIKLFFNCIISVFTWKIEKCSSLDDWWYNPIKYTFIWLCFIVSACALIFLGINLVDVKGKNICIEEHYIMGIDKCTYQSSSNYGSKYLCDVLLSNNKKIYGVLNPKNGPFCVKYECAPGKLFGWEIPNSCEQVEK